MEKCYVRGVLDEGFGKEVSNREREAARLPALRSDAAQGAHPQASGLRPHSLISDRAPQRHVSRGRLQVRGLFDSTNLLVSTPPPFSPPPSPSPNTSIYASVIYRQIVCLLPHGLTSSGLS